MQFGFISHSDGALGRAPMNDSLTVTVVFVAPTIEDVSEVRVLPLSTVRDAIDAAGVLTRHPELNSVHAEVDVGIWGRRCSLDQPIKNGDRVEIYRPLVSDPKEARRLRVEQRRKGRGRS